LNLLQSDQSTLDVDQWNLLSNLIHCYDEHSGLSLTEHFIDEQNALPLKFRFKSQSIVEFFRCMLSEGQLIYENNGNFLSLCSHDRSTLIRSTAKHVACIDATLVGRRYGLIDHPCFYKSSEILLGSSALTSAKRTIDLVDSDITFVKLALSILAFSTISYTVYENTIPINLTNVNSIIRVQDMYIEIAWRYLLYKYGHIQAVLCFSKLIQWIFSINLTIVKVDRYKDLRAIMDYVVEQTEQTLVIDS
jgi:hypothetical protein